MRRRIAAPGPSAPAWCRGGGGGGGRRGSDLTPVEVVKSYQGIREPTHHDRARPPTRPPFPASRIPPGRPDPATARSPRAGTRGRRNREDAATTATRDPATTGRDHRDVVAT